MIISVEKLKTYKELKDLTDEDLKLKSEAIESFIRSYTNNNFQNRNVRIVCTSKDNKLIGHSPYLKVGDTIQITQSLYNDGLYVITNITDDEISIDKDIFDTENNVVTKIEYPVAITQGVVNLLKWEVENRSKMGIASESISRHSVSYVNQNTSDNLMGYPISLLSFLYLYKKARF